jgi:hypothetical protein
MGLELHLIPVFLVVLGVLAVLAVLVVQLYILYNNEEVVNTLLRINSNQIHIYS